MGGPSYIWFEGHKLDPRTRDMIVALRVICDAPVEITQGSYNTSVSASAGTHAGGGAVDIRAVGRTDAERAEIILKARHVGFAAWLRHPDEGPWPYHHHCIAIDCPDLSAGAANQVVDYHEGRNGLANNRADDGPRAYVSMTWEKYKKQYPDLLTEDTLSAQDVTEIKGYVTSELSRFFGFLEKPNGNIDQQLGATEAVIQAALRAQSDADQAQYTSVVAEIRATQKIATDAVAALGTSTTSQITALTQQVAALAKVVAALPKA